LLCFAALKVIDGLRVTPTPMTLPTARSCSSNVSALVLFESFLLLLDLLFCLSHGLIRRSLFSSCLLGCGLFGCGLFLHSLLGSSLFRG
jgi:hypothetical protein